MRHETGVGRIHSLYVVVEQLEPRTLWSMTPALEPSATADALSPLPTLAADARGRDTGHVPWLTPRVSSISTPPPTPTPPQPPAPAADPHQAGW